MYWYWYWYFIKNHANHVLISRSDVSSPSSLSRANLFISSYLPPPHCLTRDIFFVTEVKISHVRRPKRRMNIQRNHHKVSALLNTAKYEFSSHIQYEISSWKLTLAEMEHSNTQHNTRWTNYLIFTQRKLMQCH